MTHRRIALVAPATPPLTLGRTLAHLWACWWWCFRDAVATLHGFPPEAVEDPPSPWLRRIPRGRGHS